ncbi:ankyrin repeat protein [Mollivirus sibericum]|uniref:ankyrin repeat protein n=1 Tax=Mollivirus sibericum TaxID=1678078 RepID=UPI0006B2DC24|nr:ankyrin repeat protein [Mollivirus sibericum]ALD62054.1 ankyrin repeat protein [Mollivirus sibericum]
MQDLDKELVNYIFGFLHPTARPVAVRVNRKWREAYGFARPPKTLEGADLWKICQAKVKDRGVPFATALAAEGDTHLLQWALDQGCVLDDDACGVAAVKKGHLHVLEWFRSLGRRFGPAVGIAAARHNFGLLKWLGTEDYDLDVRMLSSALKSARPEETVPWIIDNAGYDMNLEEAFRRSPHKANLTSGLIDWFDAFGMSQSTILRQSATASQSMRVIDRLAQDAASFSPRLDVAAAVSNGRTDYLQALLAGGPIRRTNPLLVDNARCLPAVELMLRSDPEFRPMDLERAIAKGCAEVVEWFLDKGFRFPYACVQAAYYGNLGILRLLRAKGCPWDSDTRKWALANGHVDMLPWLNENDCPALSDEGIGAALETAAHKAIASGNVAMLEWLKAIDYDLDAEPVCIASLVVPYSNVINTLDWLAANIARFDVRVCAEVVEPHQHQAIRWLREHGGVVDVDQKVQDLAHFRTANPGAEVHNFFGRTANENPRLVALLARDLGYDMSPSQLEHLQSRNARGTNEAAPPPPRVFAQGTQRITLQVTTMPLLANQATGYDNAESDTLATETVTVALPMNHPLLRAESNEWNILYCDLMTEMSRRLGVRCDVRSCNVLQTCADDDNDDTPADIDLGHGPKHIYRSL